MLTKSDLSSIKQVVRSEIQEEFKPLKTDIAILKTDVAGLKVDVRTLKSDVSVLKTDVATLKDDMSFTKNAVMSLLDESQKIHEALVREKLPERVHRLEHIVQATAS